MFEIFGIPSQALFGQLLLGLINGSFYALLSLGLAVIFGMLNIINFTHGAQYMMGAFVAFFLLQYAGLNYWFALVIAPALAKTIPTAGHGGIDYRTFVIIGTVGLLIPLNTMFAGLGVIVDRESGAQRELLAAPIPRSLLVLGNLTVAYAITALQIVVGVAAALILHERFPGSHFLRGVALFPYMIPTVIAVFVWRWLMNDLYGVIPYMLSALPIPGLPEAWLTHGTIMWVLIILSVWTFFPFVLVNVLARLQTIPPELYDAARVDGASAVRQFIHVTLPQLRNVLLIVLLLRGIWMFTKFDVPWLLGFGGGAGEAIRTLPARQREALVLRVYHDHAFADIGVIMSCSEGTAKANYHHAVDKLRRVLMAGEG